LFTGGRFLRRVRGAVLKSHSAAQASGLFFEEKCQKIPLGMNEDVDSKLSVISVVIPAYNEEKTVRAIIQRAHQILRDVGMPYEIVVVDDGSTDETARIASQNNAVLVANGINRGKGHSLCMGIEKSKGSIVVTMDADGAHQPEEIPKLLFPILKSPHIDAVIGSRFLGDLDVSAMSKLHFVGNKLINLTMRILTGKWISDSQSGFRAYRREVFDSMKIESMGFDIETELTIKALVNGFTIAEVPITCMRRVDSVSRLNTFKDGLAIFRTIFESSLSESVHS
jgi:glycosyltransferase involved in cell wall biosynthesis